MDKDKQMSFLFEEGGIADDGMDRDPISGNEVPPGSLAEEVRDDIPAQLSEGEYVVPADVVRYYGVKFFEDLRGEAKMGLNQMDRDGRIGGEPIDMQGGEGLSPEEEAELQALMGMAMGGMVTEQPTQATDPFMAQTNLYRDPNATATGYNTGGLTTGSDPTQVQFDPMQFPAGFSFAQPSQGQQSATITLYGPSGEIEVLTLPAQQARYTQLIGLGYTSEKAAGPQVTPEATLEITAPGDSGGGGGEFTTFSGEQPRDLSELSIEELQSNLRGLDTINRIGGALASAVNPMFAMAARAALAANRNNLVQELVNRGVDMSDYRAQYGRDLYGGGISMYDGLQDTSRDGKVGFGDTWLGDLLGFDGKAGVQGPGLSDSRSGARRDFSTTTTPTAPASTSTIASSSSNDRDSDSSSFSGATSRAPASSPTPSPAPGRGGSGGRTGSTGDRSISDGTGAGPGGRDAVGPMNKGGFVSRRNKNKK
jgi:hypothetical protein